MKQWFRRVSGYVSNSLTLLIQVLILIVSLYLPTTISASSDTTYDILILHSYHPSYDWTQSIHDGIISELDRWGASVNLSIEYMDTKRLYTPEHVEGLVTLYTAKYHRSPPDLIISSDNNAFSLLYEHREEIFGTDVPVVFCAVNFFQQEDWAGMTNILGVDERPDLDATIKLIDRMYPWDTSVAFVNDLSVTGQAFRTGYEKWLAKQDNPERYLLVDQGYPDDIFNTIEKLSGDWIIHYSVYNRDPDEVVYPPLELLERLARETDLPIYGNYSYMLGSGINGGPVIDGYLQGTTAVGLGVDVLEGRRNPEDFVLMGSPFVHQFDYLRIKDTGVHLSRIPENSTFINEPQIFWKEYPGETGFAAAALITLLLGLIFVTRLLHQRSKLADDISTLNLELEDRVQSRSEALQRAERELVRSEKLSILGSLVAGITHEVNNPLGLILTSSSFLEEKLESSRKAYKKGVLTEEDMSELLTDSWKICRSITSNSKRAADQISNFKRVAVDQYGEAQNSFFMKEMLDNFLLSMSVELKRNTVRVEIDCPETLYLTHFPGDLWRILANLLMNSLKHAFADGEEGSVWIHVRSEDGNLCIRYMDNGRGIDENEIKNIYDPFFTTARNSGGTGLGLRIVQSIVVDRHGGSIQVFNREEGGICFTILLPETSPALEQ